MDITWSNIEYQNGHNLNINMNINWSLGIKNQIIFFDKMKTFHFIFLRNKIKIYYIFRNEKLISLNYFWLDFQFYLFNYNEWNTFSLFELKTLGAKTPTITSSIIQCRLILQQNNIQHAFYTQFHKWNNTVYRVGTIKMINIMHPTTPYSLPFLTFFYMKPLNI